MSRHLTTERRAVLGMLNALNIDVEQITAAEYGRLILAAGIGIRDGYPDDVLEIFYKQDQMLRANK